MEYSEEIHSQTPTTPNYTFPTAVTSDISSPPTGIAYHYHHLGGVSVRMRAYRHAKTHAPTPRFHKIVPPSRAQLRKMITHVRYDGTKGWGGGGGQCAIWFQVNKQGLAPQKP